MNVEVVPASSEVSTVMVDGEEVYVTVDADIVAINGDTVHESRIVRSKQEMENDTEE